MEILVVIIDQALSLTTRVVRTAFCDKTPLIPHDQCFPRLVKGTSTAKSIVIFECAVCHEVWHHRMKAARRGAEAQEKSRGIASLGRD